MTNKYGIPEEDLIFIRERDKSCVYCRKQMICPCEGDNRSDWATIEHLNHLPEWDSVRSYVREGRPVSEIITICCGSCNSSRGNRSLSDWFKTDYCIKNNINEDNVAEPVREYLQRTQ